MKKTIRLLSVLLLAVLVLSLVSCSSFDSVRKNFEKNGYTYLENTSEESTAKKITAELEEGEISCTAHLFKTDGAILSFVPSYALVLEFGSDAEAKEAIENVMEKSATLAGLVRDLQKSELVNKNCILIPLTLTKASEMITIFGGGTVTEAKSK